MKNSNLDVPIYFADIFEVDKEILERYGAFNISLLSDLPLFIDPFLLFNSDNPEYRELHSQIIKYLKYLKEKSIKKEVTPGLLDSLYRFKEVRQNWFGYSRIGNKGSALGKKFAKALDSNFYRIFNNYGNENITKDSHLEKLCLIEEGVGKDNISDFTTNMIKEFLLDFTQTFSKEYINDEYCRNFIVNKVRFNYTTEVWERAKFYLPSYNDEFVLLTPKDLLTKDDTWINRTDLLEEIFFLPDSIPDGELRSHINNYLRKALSENPSKKEQVTVSNSLVREFPILVDYFIRRKEDRGDQAINVSDRRVKYSQDLYVEKFKAVSNLLAKETKFYELSPNSYEECVKRAHFLKHVIEDKDGYRMFYDREGKAIQKEEDLKIAYRLTWFSSPFSVDTEVNNGRGPADTVVAMGQANASIVEFKLASNKKLKQNLENQVQIYEKARDTDKSIKIILYFNENELKRVEKILRELDLQNEKSIILIDARKKEPASTVK